MNRRMLLPLLAIAAAALPMAAAETVAGHRLTLRDGRVLDGVWNPAAGELDTSHLGIASRLSIDPADVVRHEPRDLPVRVVKPGDAARARRAAQESLLRSAEAAIARLEPQEAAARTTLAGAAAAEQPLRKEAAAAAGAVAAARARLDATPPEVRWLAVPAARPPLACPPAATGGWNAQIGIPLGNAGRLTLRAGETWRQPAPPAFSAPSLVAITVPGDSRGSAAELELAEARRARAQAELRQHAQAVADAERILAELATARADRARWRQALGLDPAGVEL